MDVWNNYVDLVLALVLKRLLFLIGCVRLNLSLFCRFVYVIERLVVRVNGDKFRPRLELRLLMLRITTLLAATVFSKLLVLLLLSIFFRVHPD